MEQSNIDLIKTAIADRKQLFISYNGSVRRLHPHLLGTDKNGAKRLRAVQIATSEANPVGEPVLVEHDQAWKLFDLEKISFVAMSGDDSQICEGYNQESDQVIVNPIAKV
jgi:hypothetical protein